MKDVGEVLLFFFLLSSLLLLLLLLLLLFVCLFVFVDLVLSSRTLRWPKPLTSLTTEANWRSRAIRQCSMMYAIIGSGFGF
jgi:hypothetical protein